MSSLQDEPAIVNNAILYPCHSTLWLPWCWKNILLKYIVENAGEVQIATVVNVVIALNVDSALVPNTRAVNTKS